MRIFLALLFLASAPCMGANFAKVGEIYKGKLGTDDVEVGAIVSNKIKPQLKLYKWDGEDSLTVNFPSMGSINKTAATCNGSTVTFACAAGTIRVYVTPEGYLEYDGLFNSVPWSSVQLTLTGWEAFDFAQYSSTSMIQIYHKKKRDGKYGIGYLFTILPPCWIAADGARLPCTQTIVNGTWTISWDKAWTDAAAKPLILDPTIGNTGTYYAGLERFNYWRGIPVLSTGNITISSLKVCCYSKGANSYLKPTLHSDKGDLNPGALISVGSEVLLTGTTQYVDLPLSGNCNLTAGTTYWLGVYHHDGDNAMVHYTLTQGNKGIKKSMWTVDNYDTPGNPISLSISGTSDWDMCVYAEYSAGDGSPAPSVPFLHPVMLWEN